MISKTVNIPPFRERGPVRITHDPFLIRVVPSTFGERKVPAYGFVRKSDGVEIATVPYQDRDAIFSYEDNCIFQSMSFVSGHVKHWIASTRWWRINPITITFGWVPSI